MKPSSITLADLPFRVIMPPGDPVVIATRTIESINRLAEEINEATERSEIFRSVEQQSISVVVQVE